MTLTAHTVSLSSMCDEESSPWSSLSIKSLSLDESTLEYELEKS